MLFVAEIGLNHDGNFDLAYELIRQAKLAGADIAKFQFGWRHKPEEINHIPLERAQTLKKWCDYLNIEMMASFFTEEGFEIGKAIGLNRYKIASRTVKDNPELCEKILAEKKETFVSLGFWEGQDVPFGRSNAQLRYIFCRSKYPSYPEDMKSLPDMFSKNGYYGYSDHCHGIAACLVAIARGAEFIEKHFTLNKTSQVIRDHILSATPDEFKQLTHIGQEINRLVKVMGKPVHV